MFQPDRGMAILTRIDVGWGTGIHLDMYRRFGCSLHGSDSLPSMLEVAQERLSAADEELRLTDATQMPYGDGEFDFVFSMLALHEMEDMVRTSVIGEIERVLSNQGRILLIYFHASMARQVKGWITKLVILFSEIAAGRRHFRNCRQFMSTGGLPALIRDSRLSTEPENIVGGDTLSLYLLRAV